MSTSSYSSRRSCLSNWHTYITRAITLSLPSLALSSKIPPISRPSTRGIVSSSLIYCYPSLMPPLVASIYCVVLIALILFISEIMPSCSCYIEKGLVYIIIILPFSRQPLSCTKCIKANIYLSCNIYSISTTKYIYYSILLNCLVPYLSYYRVSDLICCWETRKLALCRL